MSTQQTKLHRGDLVREFRKQSNWTQEILASMVGVDVRTIQRLEKSGVADNETLIGVANAFKIPVENLDFLADPAKQQEFQKLLKKIRILKVILDGKQLFDMVGGSDGLIKDHPMPSSTDEAALFSQLLQDIDDWGSIWDDVSQQSKMDAMFQITDLIKELDSKGFCVFGERRKMKFVNRENKNSIPAEIATIIVVKSDHKGIVIDEHGNKTFASVYENEFSI